MSNPAGFPLRVITISSSKNHIVIGIRQYRSPQEYQPQGLGNRGHRVQQHADIAVVKRAAIGCSGRVMTAAYSITMQAAILIASAAVGVSKLPASRGFKPDIALA
jgi:hypothetical protein